MSDIYIEVFWDSGMEAYSFTALPFSTYQSLPLLMSVSDIIYSIRFDGEIENQTVTITLSNHNRYFDTKMASDPTIVERVVKIKNSTMTLFTGLVREMPDFSDENVFVLKVDIFSLIDREINKRITKTEFPNCPVQNFGKYANYIAGIADTYPAAFTAVRIDSGKYLAAWNNVGSITDVFDGETQITEYVVTHDSDYTVIECSSTSDEILFSGHQKSFEYDPLPGDPMPIDNPVDLLQYILEITGSGISINAANQEYAWQRFRDRDHTGNVFIAGKTTVKEFLQDFARSYNCFVRFNRNLEIEFTFTEYNVEPGIVIHPTYVKNFEKKIDNTYPCGSFVRKYHYLPAKDYQITPLDVIPPVQYNTKIGELLQKFIIDDITSFDIASRERYLREKPLLYVSLQVPKSFTDAIMPGDYILIKHHRNFFPNEYRKILVMRIVSNRKKVLDTIEGFDFSDLETKNSFFVCDASDPDLQYIDVPGAPTNPIVTWVK